MKKLLIALFILGLPIGLNAGANDLTLKKGDLLPYYYLQIKDSSGAFDITSYNIYFSMRKVGASTNKVDRQAMTKTTVASGYCEYHWVTADTNTTGNYIIEVTVELASNTTTVFSLPTTRIDYIIIKDNFN